MSTNDSFWTMLDLSCKRMPCPFANEQHVCIANSCIKDRFSTEEDFWANYDKVLLHAATVISNFKVG